MKRNELYEEEKDLAPYIDVSKGENILKEEVEHVLKTIKNGKVTGTDEIPNHYGGTQSL